LNISPRMGSEPGGSGISTSLPVSSCVAAGLI